MKRLLISIFVCTITLASYSQVVAPEDFQKGLSQKDVQLLDVRTATEYKNAHIKNSLQADWNKPDQFKDRVQYIDKSKPIYVYCAAGVRSSAAAKWMRENGFKDVKELKGGLTAWKADQKPTEGLPDEPQITPEAYTALLGKSQTVLVDFGAEWCPPCIQMNPVIESLQKDLKKKFQLVKMDPTVQTAIATQLKIEVQPTFLIYKDGKEIYRKEGVASYDELKAALLK